MRQKIALLHNINRGKSEHEVDFDLPSTIDTLKNSIEINYDCLPIEGHEDIAKWISKLVAYKADLVFNIAEGYRGAAREAFYPALLEQLNINYTGPGPTELFLTHNKSLTKELLKPHNILMPWSKLISTYEDFEVIKSKILSYPVIVKLNSEGSSKGMDSDCICRNLIQLDTQILKLFKKYESNILIEQFIPGKDLSMTYIEGLGIFGPVGYVYPEKEIYDQKLKDSDNNKVDVVIDSSVLENTINKLNEISELVVNILDINGYFRIDYRIDNQERPYLLEINGQVCFHPDGAFVKATFEKGQTYDSVVRHIIQNALITKRRISKATTVPLTF